MSQNHIEWQTKKLREVCKNITSGGTPSRTNSEYFGGNTPWLKIGDLNNSTVYDSTEKITKKGLESSSANLLPKNTVLIAMYGATIGKTAILGSECATNQAICALQCSDLLEPDFLHYFLKSQYFKIRNMAEGAAQPNINQNKIKELEISFPPRDLQKKIVQKLDYILGQLEEKKKTIAPLQEISKLKILAHATYQNVLRSALSGELTKQINNGHSTLDRTSKKITVHTSNSNRIEFKDFPKLPCDWDWVTMEEATVLITDGDHQTPPRLSDGKPMLSAKNIRDGYIDWKNIQYVSDRDFQKSLKRCNPTRGDILMVCVGATIGRAAIVDTDEPFMLVRSVALLRTSSKIHPHYLLAVINYSETQKHMMSNRNISAQPGLYLSQIKKIPIPLPPLKEQEYIIEKLRNYKEKINIINNNAIEKIIENRIRLVSQYDYLTRQILEYAFSGKLIN